MADYSQTQLNALREAIASGELTVEFDGRRVTYRSIDELLRAKREVESALSGTERPRTTLAYRVKG